MFCRVFYENEEKKVFRPIIKCYLFYTFVISRTGCNQEKKKQRKQSLTFFNEDILTS